MNFHTPTIGLTIFDPGRKTNDVDTLGVASQFCFHLRGLTCSILFHSNPMIKMNQDAMIQFFALGVNASDTSSIFQTLRH